MRHANLLCFKNTFATSLEDFFGREICFRFFGISIFHHDYELILLGGCWQGSQDVHGFKFQYIAREKWSKCSVVVGFAFISGAALTNRFSSVHVVRLLASIVQFRTFFIRTSPSKVIDFLAVDVRVVKVIFRVFLVPHFGRFCYLPAFGSEVLYY